MTNPRDRVSSACRAMTSAGGPVAVDHLATSLGCSARQLQRDFVDVLGITPRQYGQAVRTDP